MSRIEYKFQEIIDKLWEIRTGAERIIPGKLNIDEIIDNENLSDEVMGGNSLNFKNESDDIMDAYSNKNSGFEELDKKNTGKMIKIELSEENFTKNLFPVGQIKKLLNPLNLSKIQYPPNRIKKHLDKMKFINCLDGEPVQLINNGYIIRRCYKCDYKWWRENGLTYCDYPIILHTVSLDENQGIGRYSTDYCYYVPDTKLEFFTDAIAMDGGTIKKITWVNENTHIMHLLHANEIKRCIAEQLQGQEYWHVLIYPRNELKIEMTIDNNQVKYLFKNREKNNQTMRKDALLNFVNQHERAIIVNDEINYCEVKKHLRGSYKLNCFGYYFEIIPNERAMYEQEKNHRQSEKTRELLELLERIND